MDRNRLYDTYGQADCLVFPSRVETWGLPISEFAAFGKPMLLADLPYAHETAAGSPLTAFFPPTSPAELKELMKRLVQGDSSFLNPVPARNIAAPTARTWEETFRLMINDQ